MVRGFVGLRSSQGDEHQEAGEWDDKTHVELTCPEKMAENLERVEAVQKKFAEFNQAHIFHHWDSLSDLQREQLISEAEVRV